jgi:hypothetical protein
MTTETRFPPPPKPSLPREAPWREIEEIIDGLKAVATKLDILISTYTGVPPTPPGEVPPPIIVTPVIIPNKATWRHGQKNVTTAGIPVQLDPLEIPDGYPVTIIAKTGNTGYIYLAKTGGECVDGIRFDGLSAGLAHSLRVKNLNQIWIDADTDGEGVSWSVEYDN